MLSGTIIKLKQHLKTANDSQLPAGTKAVVLGVARNALPAIYHCETLPCSCYEVESFYCCGNHFEIVEEAA